MRETVHAHDIIDIADANPALLSVSHTRAYSTKSVLPSDVDQRGHFCCSHHL
jgi:hypothetical protein